MNICSKGMTKLPVSYRTFGTCQAEFETLNVGALSAISSQLSALPTEGTWAIMRGVPSRLRCVEIARYGSTWLISATAEWEYSKIFWKWLTDGFSILIVTQTLETLPHLPYLPYLSSYISHALLCYVMFVMLSHLILKHILPFDTFFSRGIVRKTTSWEFFMPLLTTMETIWDYLFHRSKAFCNNSVSTHVTTEYCEYFRLRWPSTVVGTACSPTFFWYIDRLLQLIELVPF